MARTTYNPWRDLRHRDHIRFAFTDLPDGFEGIYARRGQRAAILLDDQLTRVARRAVLAHELAHDERGGGCDHPDMPETWAAVVARDEATVDRIARNRLIPPVELVEWLSARGDEPTEAWHIAEEWDVPVSVAAAVEIRKPM